MTFTKLAGKKQPSIKVPVSVDRSNARGIYRECVISAMTSILNPVAESNRAELGELVHDSLINLGPPRTIKRKLNSLEEYVGKLFQGYIEIAKSLQMLEDISFYIGRFPFSKTHITHENYLRFHVEAFVSEVYVLRERLQSYLKLFERQFKKDASIPNASSIIGEAKEIVDSHLDSIVKIRGAHVHEYRLSEDFIDRIGSLDLLRRYGGPGLAEVAEANYRTEVKRVRKNWRDSTKKNIRSIESFLDIYFLILYRVAFNPETKEARIPKGIRVKAN